MCLDVLFNELVIGHGYVPGCTFQRTCILSTLRGNLEYNASHYLQNHMRVKLN